jgi:hypothetical protein
VPYFFIYTGQSSTLSPSCKPLDVKVELPVKSGKSQVAPLNVALAISGAATKLAPCTHVVPIRPKLDSVSTSAGVSSIPQHLL